MAELTGLTSADLAGSGIDDADAVGLIGFADVVVAHNAAFDRPFVEARLPAVVGQAWACTLRDLDLRGLGFEGRSLPHLLSEVGWFYGAHRAETDVSALLHLLDHRLPDGGTVLRALIGSASRPNWSIEAIAAPFGAKDLLKGRGYRWDATGRFWSREVSEDRRAEEVEWIVSRVYDGYGSPRERRLDWWVRHAVR